MKRFLANAVVAVIVLGTSLVARAESPAWVQSEQSEFETCKLISVDTVTSPGNVTLGRDLSEFKPYSADKATILLLHFDDLRGELRDRSGRGQGIANHGAAPVEGRFGKALKFDGAEDYLSLAGTGVAIDTGNATWEFWLKTSHTGSSNRGIIGGNNINGQYAALVDADGRAQMHFNDTAANYCFVRSKTVINDNQWHHVAVTRDGGVFTMYVDGVYSAKGEGWKGSRENPVTEDIEHPSWYPMTIGRDLWQGGFFRGELDELRISNVVRDFSAKWPPASSGAVISPTVNFEGETVTGVIIEWEHTVPAGASIAYSASNDGGKTWHRLSRNNDLFSFPSSNPWGDDLRLKSELSRGNSKTGPTLHGWKATYTGSGLTRYERWQKNRPFTQSVWYGDGIFAPGFGKDGKIFNKPPPHAPHPDMGVFRKSGLNMLIDNAIANGGHDHYPAVANAQAAGVDYMIRTPGRWGGPWDFDGFAGFVRFLADDPKKWSGFVGIKIADEPREGGYRERRDWIVENYPHLLTIVGEACGTNPLASHIRRLYESHAEHIRPDALCFQFYPTHWSADGRANPLFFAGLDYWSEFCKKRRIGFWTYPQVAFHGKAYSDSTLRIEKFAALAYGVQGFQDFMYDGDSVFPGRDPEQSYVKMVKTSQGDAYEPTTSYPLHAAINHEVAHIAKALIRLQHVRTYHLDEPPQFTEEPQGARKAFHWSCHSFSESDQLRTGLLKGVSSESNHLIVGCFRDEGEKEYFMVVNKNNHKDVPSTDPSMVQVITMTFSPRVTAIQRLNRRTGEVNALSLTDHAYTFKLAGGSGELFRFHSKAPFAGIE